MQQHKIHELLGDYWYKEDNEYSKAIELFVEAFQIDSSNSDLAFKLGRWYDKLAK